MADAKAAVASGASAAGKPAVCPPTVSPRSNFATFFPVLWNEIARDDLLLRASALAYATIASLVPIVAIILAVLSGPAFEAQREAVLDTLAAGMVPAEHAESAWIIETESPEQQHFKSIFRSEISKLASKLGAVSVFGFFVLVATAGMLFRQVEGALNIIWRSTVRRSIPMRIAIATSVIFWGPVMLAVSVTITEKLGQYYPLLGTYLLPSLLTTLAFTALYMVMPHTKVHWRFALAGGFAAALLWEIAKLAFLLYVTYAVNYSRVYGSLGLIPMLFLWVYINWVLILLGAEAAYCFQNWAVVKERWITDCEEEREAKPKSAMQAPPSIVLAVAIEVVRHFSKFGGKGVPVSVLAKAMSVDTALVLDAAERLSEGHVLARVDGGESGDPAFLPACDPAKCEASHLLATACDEKEHLGGGEAVERSRKLLEEAAKARAGQARTLAELAA
jgi:membrane protein